MLVNNDDEQRTHQSESPLPTGSVFKEWVASKNMHPLSTPDSRMSEKDTHPEESIAKQFLSPFPEAPIEGELVRIRREALQFGSEDARSAYPHVVRDVYALTKYARQTWMQRHPEYLGYIGIYVDTYTMSYLSETERLDQQAQQRSRQAPLLSPPVTGGWQSKTYPNEKVNRQQAPRKNRARRTFLLPILVVLLIIAVLFYNLLDNPGQQATGITPSNGIGATKASDGEYIGVSDGTVAFDIGRADGILKAQAAAKLKAGDASSAEALWSEAIAIAGESNDAEALIYQEDQRVLASGNPYITIVVSTMLSGTRNYVGAGHDDLQGAYVAQREFNDGFKLPNSVLVRLLVANSGMVPAYAVNVAHQIVQAAQADKTIVGVMGWPLSGSAFDAISVLAAAHIPMVSQTASSDSLTKISPYFFRVAPTNSAQGLAGAQYAEQKLHAKKVALFYNPTDLYSNGLAKSFSQNYLSGGNSNSIVATEKFTAGKMLPGLLQDALTHNPDLIYLSGYSINVGVLLTDLPTSGPLVMGGDALYGLGGYPPSASPNFNKLRFTAFAYPDEWQIQSLKQPAFFTDYTQDFDPAREHVNSPYGYRRQDAAVILSYDAMLALLGASKNVLARGTQTGFTPDELQQALRKITGAQAIQGISGQISFGTDGNAINKAFVVLEVDPAGHIKLESVQGCFLIRASC